MSKTQDLINQAERYGAKNYHPLPIVLSKGEGIWVWDVEGKKYLDCLSAYSAVNQGHRHPRLVNAMKDQLDRLTLTSRAFHNDQMGNLLEKLCNFSGMDLSLLMNSGAEAVETAIKAARKWGYTKKGVEKDRAEIIVCNNNFHGRTTTIVGFSSEEDYRSGFGPFTPGFKLIDFNDPSQLESAITKNTVAFLVEPMQGEAGVNIPSDDYLFRCQEVCQKNNVLFILDEIQTGLGRTGKNFAYLHDERVRPDAVIIGKALSGGFYPVSAVVSRKEVLGVFNPGEHGSTFGGNPLGCAVACEALKVIVDENLASRSWELGSYLKKRLKEINSPHIQEVRGKGLFIGVEIKKSSGTARPFCERLGTLGLLAKETHGQVIRLTPPLIIEKAEVDWIADQVSAVLK